MTPTYLTLIEQKVDRSDPWKVFHASICDVTPTNDPIDIEDDAVVAVLEVDDRFSFAETDWIDDRTIEITAYYF